MIVSASSAYAALLVVLRNKSLKMSLSLDFKERNGDIGEIIASLENEVSSVLQICSMCLHCHSEDRVKSPLLPPSFLETWIPSMDISFPATALSMSQTVRRAIDTAVKASISTPVFPSHVT